MADLLLATVNFKSWRLNNKEIQDTKQMGIECSFCLIFLCNIVSAWHPSQIGCLFIDPIWPSQLVSGLPWSGKNVLKMKFFPGQGKIREFCGWPGKFREDLESQG